MHCYNLTDCVWLEFAGVFLSPNSIEAAAMSGVPLELVKYDTATGKFLVGTEALAVLRKVKAPLGVVAVCGRARQGKSFILNQLLQQTGSHGFTVGPTHRPCTKGLWMWSSPQKRVNADGSESYLVSGS